MSPYDFAIYTKEIICVFRRPTKQQLFLADFKISLNICLSVHQYPQTVLLC